VFDALSTPRVYKKAWSDDKVKKVLEEGKGKDFDPILIELFLESFDEFIDIKNSFL
jgi:putative two-component system response regulator